MKINKSLVIINSSEFYDDGKNKHFRSGIEQQIEELSRHFKKAYLYAPKTKKKFSGYVFKNVQVRPVCLELHDSYIGLAKKYNEYKKNLDKIIIKHKEDIFCIYFPDSFIGMIAAELCRKHKVKYFLRVTANLAQEFKVRGNSKIRKASSVIINPILNHIVINLVKDTLSFYSGNILYKTTGKHYSVRSASFNEDIIYKRKDTCFKKPYNILFVGRFDAKKGLKFLLEAISRVRKNQDVKLIIVGFGEWSEEEKEMKERVKNLGIEDIVEFKGFIPFGPKLFTEFKKADIFVFPSLDETYPKTPIEAMAFGIPVIATNMGSVPNYVINEKTGLLIRPSSVDDIERSIIKLIENKKLRKKLIRNGYDIAKNSTLKIQANFMVKKITEYYKL